jgi:hypothetical protein
MLFEQLNAIRPRLVALGMALDATAREHIIEIIETLDRALERRDVMAASRALDHAENLLEILGDTVATRIVQPRKASTG